MNLVELKPLLPADTIFDLRYVTPGNIAKKVLYTGEDTKARLDEPAAEALVYAANLIVKKNLRLVVWDTYRPLEAQKILQAVNADPRFVLDPSKSKHPKGLAADVSLAYQNGQLLDMGTDFDAFEPLAYVGAPQLTFSQREKRELLSSPMEKAGFVEWPYEWWHFDYVGKPA